MNSQPHADSLLTRSEAGRVLRNLGFPVADKTLATRASRGRGPIFRRFGAKPLYRFGDLLAWAESRLGPPIGSSAELDKSENK
jgi:hypothetical protein